MGDFEKEKKKKKILCRKTNNIKYGAQPLAQV